MSDIEYKIALVAPTRVGKTSLVSSILHSAQSALAGTAVSMTANGPTARRISDNVNELEAALAHGTFEPEAIRNSTSDKSIYELGFEVAKTRVSLRILDYPGGWLSGRTAEWESCMNWVKDASVLLIPVDAVVAMQAVTLSEQQAARHRLDIDTVIGVARQWAKQRKIARKPGTVLLVPVKCESYVKGPGASRETTQKLYGRVVNNLYEQLQNVLDEELAGFEGVSAYYVPVSTMGCVDLVDSNWKPAEDGKLECHATFRVLPPGKRKVEGALDILSLISRQIMEAEESADSNIFRQVLRMLTGEGRAIRDELVKLKTMSLSPRVHKLFPR
jgi:hypothetical protein